MSDDVFALLREGHELTRELLFEGVPPDWEYVLVSVTYFVDGRAVDEQEPLYAALSSAEWDDAEEVEGTYWRVVERLKVIDGGDEAKGEG